jgi:hypothetical protein
LHRILEIASERFGENGLDEAASFLIDPRSVAPFGSGDLHLKDNDVRIIRDFTQGDARGFDLIGRRRSLDKEDAMTERQPGVKLLRALLDPIPPEVRMDDDREIG